MDLVDLIFDASRGLIDDRQDRGENFSRRRAHSAIYVCFTGKTSTSVGIIWETLQDSQCDRRICQATFSAHEVSLMKASQPPSIPPGVAVPFPVALLLHGNSWLLEKSGIEAS